MGETGNYQGKFFSILGDSISTLDGYNPPDHAVFYDWQNKRRSHVYTPSDTWWGIVIDTLGGRLLINNAWSASTVCKHPLYEIESYGCSDSRTSGLGVGTLHPDVIMILMGLNDWGRGTRVDPVEGEEDLTIFSKAYACMLDKIKKNYPHSEIWCMTLPRSCWRSNPDFRAPECFAGVTMADYCEAIRQCAAAAGCVLIDLNVSDMPYDTIDGYHPNADGMRTIADTILSTFAL